jgi:hypothetical protein
MISLCSFAFVANKISQVDMRSIMYDGGVASSACGDGRGDEPEVVHSGAPFVAGTSEGRRCRFALVGWANDLNDLCACGLFGPSS